MLATDTPDQENADPSLENLVPKGPQIRRFTLLIVIASLMLVTAVWMSPTLFRPNVLDDQTGVGGHNLERHGQVYTIVKFHNHGPTSVTVQSAKAPPGTSLESAWLIDVPPELAGPSRDDFESDRDYDTATQAYREANDIDDAHKKNRRRRLATTHQVPPGSTPNTPTLVTPPRCPKPSNEEARLGSYCCGTSKIATFSCLTPRQK